jgi:hypothetical protein
MNMQSLKTWASWAKGLKVKIGTTIAKNNPLHKHRWVWYLPNTESTIIGTQWCPHCAKLRGVRLNPNH